MSANPYRTWFRFGVWGLGFRVWGLGIVSVCESVSRLHVGMCMYGRICVHMHVRKCMHARKSVRTCMQYVHVLHTKRASEQELGKW